MPFASSSATLREGFAYVEGGQVQALGAGVLGADVTAAVHQVGLGHIAELLDFGEQISTSEHDWGLGDGQTLIARYGCVADCRFFAPRRVPPGETAIS
jgi:hypothetical protein